MTNQDPRVAGEVETRDSVALLEEVAHLDVRDVTTGRVRVQTHVETVEDLARATLQGHDVTVTRVPLNQPVTGVVPGVRNEGDVTIVPVFEEVLVVEKRLMLKEELHIRRRATIEEVAVPVTLRRQTATVEHLDATGRPDGEPV